MVEAVKIVLLCIAGSVAYGVLHDQITARICIEYFTVGHVRMWATDSPTMHGLLWGVIATWWVGTGLGLLVAVAARVGPGPRRDWRWVRRRLVWCLVATAVAAAVVGLQTAFTTYAPAPPGSRLAGLPTGTQHRFHICRSIHNASYAAGGLFGLVLAGRTLLSRYRLVPRDP